MSELTTLVERMAREFAESGAGAGTICVHRTTTHVTLRAVRLVDAWTGLPVPATGYGSGGRPDSSPFLVVDQVRSLLDVPADSPIDLRLRLAGDDYELQYRAGTEKSRYDAVWKFARQAVFDPGYCLPGQSLPLASTGTTTEEHDPAPWDVRVTAAASIAALAEVESVRRLDISTADIADLADLGNLSQLRVLVADRRQWQRLHELGAVPAGLAGAELAGPASFAEEISWFADLGVPTELADLPVIRGTLAGVQRPPAPFGPRALLHSWIFTGPVRQHMGTFAARSADDRDDPLTMLSGLARQVARAVADTDATAGTVMIHHGLHGRGTMMSGWVGARRRWSFEAADELARVVRAAWGVSADQYVQVRLRLSDGVYELQYRCSPDSADGPGVDWKSARQLVLDPDYRYPGHALPELPEEPAPSARPTDPSVLETVDGLVRTYVELRSEINGVAPTFGDPCAETDLAAAEARLGVRLPEDLRALYRVVGWDHDDRGLLGFTRLYRLDEIVEIHLSEKLGRRPAELDYGPPIGAWDDSLFTHERVVLEAWPHDVVRRLSRSRRWIVIGHSDRPAFAIDLDPGPLGVSGQLIQFEPHGWYSAVRRAESVTEALRRRIEALRARDQEDDEEDRTPQPLQWLDGSRPSIADLDHPIAVQKLSITGWEMFHAAELDSLPSLRAVRLTDIELAILSVPHTVPLESLHIQGPHIDLQPLSGHPTLWDLTLAGTAGLAPLTALPALQRLDISELEQADLAVLAELSTLRMLVASRDQWAYLRDHDAVPKGLAGAELAGGASFDDEIAWFAGFGVDTELANIPVVRGTL